MYPGECGVIQNMELHTVPADIVYNGMLLLHILLFFCCRHYSPAVLVFLTWLVDFFPESGVR